jgi:hypothetical protein
MDRWLRNYKKRKQIQAFDKVVRATFKVPYRNGDMVIGGNETADKSELLDTFADAIELYDRLEFPKTMRELRAVKRLMDATAQQGTGGLYYPQFYRKYPQALQIARKNIQESRQKAKLKKQGVKTNTTPQPQPTRSGETSQ